MAAMAEARVVFTAAPNSTQALNMDRRQEGFVVDSDLETESRRCWRAGLMVGAAGMAAMAAVAGTASWGMSSSNLSGLQNKEERIQMVPSYPACSKAGENCMSTGCCQTSGHKCFTKGG